MDTKRITTAILVVIVFNLAIAVNITPTKAVAQPDYFSWTSSADGVSWGSDVSRDFAYATTQPMKALAYVGASSPSADIADADQESTHASLLYYFTPSKTIARVDVKVNIAELGYYYYVLAGGGMGMVDVSVSVSKVSGGSVLDRNIYHDEFIAWVYGERAGYVGPTTWEVSQSAALSVEQYCIAVTLNVDAKARFGGSAVGGVDEYLPDIGKKAARLIVNSVELILRPPPSITITDPTTDNYGRAFYETSGATMTIGFTMDVYAFAYDPSSTLNKVQISRDNGNTYQDAGYCYSISGGHNYYYYTFNLASDPNGSGAAYTIKARASITGGASWTPSQTITVYVHQYTPPPGGGDGGGGGGCPYLYVYNGSHYINEGLFDIHSGYNGTDLVVSRVLGPAMQEVDHRYHLRLTEHWSTTSHIDQVKLYVTLDNGMTVRAPLISAVHSEYGNVLPQLFRSDDWRADTLGAMRNNGTSQSINLEFLALPPSVHVAYFTFVIEGYNPFPTY